MLEISWPCAPLVATRDEIYELHGVDDHNNHMLKTIKSTYVNERVETLDSKDLVIRRVQLKQNRKG